MKLPGQQNDPFKRALKWSSVVHGFLLGALILWPLLNRLFYREKPPEQITFIDLVTPLPPLPEVKQPEPKPVPEPKPADPIKLPDIKKVEPPKTNLVKKSEIKISTNRVKQAVSPPAQKKPSLTPEEIRKLLAAGMPQGGAPSGGPVSEMSWYYALVRATMYEAWDQPSGLAGAGLVAQVQIRVQRDGTITQRAMTRRSGHASMDESVMKAVNAVTKLKALPAEYSGGSKDITIDFELTGAAF